MDLLPVKIDIVVRAQEAIAEMRKVNGEMDRMAVKSDLASQSLAKIERRSKLAGTALLSIGSGLAFIAYSSIKASMSVEASQARLQQAVKNTGVSFNLAKPLIDSHAESMANLGFKTEDTYTALGTLTTATRSPALALKSLGVVADLARYQHESLAAAADTVSRAAMGQARGLATLGLAMGKTIPKGASFAQILDIIDTKTHNMASAFAQTSQGQMAVLQAKFELLKEQIGTGLMPALNGIVAWMAGPGMKALKSLGKFADDNKGKLEALGIVLAALWVAPKIDALLAVISRLTLGYGGLATAAGDAAIAEAAAAGGGKGGVLPYVAPKVGGVSKYIPTAILSGVVASEIGKGAPMIGSAIGLNKTAKGRDVIRGGGTAAGAGAGALTGAVAGSVVPIVGTAAGAIVGTVVGALAGFFSSGTPTPIATQTPASIQSQSMIAPSMASIYGKGPAPLISKGSGAKNPSLKSAMRQKSVAAPLVVNSNLHLDGKVVSKTVSHNAIHSTPLAGAKK